MNEQLVETTSSEVFMWQQGWCGIARLSFSWLRLKFDEVLLIRHNDFIAKKVKFDGDGSCSYGHR